MATSAQRRLTPKEVRRFGSGREFHVPPDLTRIQTESYREFLQEEVLSSRRLDQGLESVLRESSLSRATTSRSRSTTSAMNWASRGTLPTNAVSCA
jgi:hypothetical protein